mgnify:CR=1 FL=1
MRMPGPWKLLTAGCCVFLSAALIAQQPAPASRPAPDAPAALTLSQIEKPSTDSWPTYNGDYSGKRFSTLNTPAWGRERISCPNGRKV